MNKFFFTAGFAILLSGCGGGSSSDDDSSLTAKLGCDLKNASYSFQDKDPAVHFISGNIIQILPKSECNADRFLVHWDHSGDEVANSTTAIVGNKISITIPDNTILPSPHAKLIITPMLGEEKGSPADIAVVDLVGVTGPGGNVRSHWEYGVDRDALMLKIDHRGEVDYCQFDNGNVLVHDFDFQIDDSVGKGIADDIVYPAYEFDCTDEKRNLYRPILWANSELGQYTHTYSTINDAMYYGNIAFNVFEKYLGQRPFEKLRIRVHYGNQFNLNDSLANWNGAYINLNDAIYHAYGMASLDIIAHEAAHGILHEHSVLKHASESQTEYTSDARTLHEAYADMASVAAHFETYAELNWEVGEENFFYPIRYLNKIETQPGAILSYLDYQAVKNDVYKKIGIMTYPFYVLSNKWGIEKAFELFTAAALRCWQPSDNLSKAALCVKEMAQAGDYSVTDVIDAFRTVKLKLKEEDTFAHYTVNAENLQVQFNNFSETDRTIIHYRWDFGDGGTSTEISPNYAYAESGSYTVVLEVEDNLGVKDSFTRLLEVNE